MINPNNPQCFSGSVLDGASVEEALHASPEKLYNMTDPNLVVRHEKPEHRIVLMLKAQCKSNREIARMTGYTEAWISQILRQPWARVEVLRQIRENGGDEVGDILAGAVIDSIQKIIELRDTGEDDAIRLRAAQDLVDRHLGKATTRVESMATVTHRTDEVEEVDKEIDRLNAQLNLTSTSIGRN
jgi:hypothetical protein